MARRARAAATPGAPTGGLRGMGPRTMTAGARAFGKAGLGKLGGAGFGMARGSGGGGAFKASRMKKGLGGKGGGY